MEFSIDKNVPIERYSKVEETPRYPFTQMEVGDSFLIPLEHNVKSVKTYASMARRKTGHKYSILRVNKDGQYRCWRVS